MLLTKPGSFVIMYRHSYLKTAGRMNDVSFVRPAEERIAKFIDHIDFVSLLSLRRKSFSFLVYALQIIFKEVNIRRCQVKRFCLQSRKR